MEVVLDGLEEPPHSLVTLLSHRLDVVAADDCSQAIQNLISEQKSSKWKLHKPCGTCHRCNVVEQFSSELKPVLVGCIIDVLKSQSSQLLLLADQVEERNCLLEDLLTVFHSLQAFLNNCSSILSTCHTVYLTLYSKPVPVQFLSSLSSLFLQLFYSFVVSIENNNFLGEFALELDQLLVTHQWILPPSPSRVSSCSSISLKSRSEFVSGILSLPNPFSIRSIKFDRRRRVINEPTLDLNFVTYLLDLKSLEKSTFGLNAVTRFSTSFVTNFISFLPVIDNAPPKLLTFIFNRFLVLFQSFLKTSRSSHFEVFSMIFVSFIFNTYMERYGLHSRRSELVNQMIHDYLIEFFVNHCYIRPSFLNFVLNELDLSIDSQHLFFDLFNSAIHFYFCRFFKILSANSKRRDLSSYKETLSKLNTLGLDCTHLEAFLPLLGKFLDQ
ncbi:hypothetical protein GEMRC1_004118 [Eukaryota sp. GEM-RC1]